MSAISDSSLSGLTQYLSGSSSPLLSAGLSTAEIKTVVKDASPGDIVQLSDAAMQLQNIGNLFGNAQSSQQPESSDAFDALAQSENSQAETPTNQDQLESTAIQNMFGTANSGSDAASSIDLVL